MNYCLYIYVNIGDDIKQFDFTDVTSACDDDERKKTLKVSQLFHLVAALKTRLYRLSSTGRLNRLTHLIK